MNRLDLEKRLRELYIYSDFFNRKELKLLPQLLEENEQLNCILTGVHDGNRKMLAITDRRIFILFAGTLAASAVTVIRRRAVTSYRFEKKFLFSKVCISTANDGDYEFAQTQGSLRDLFEWAMKRPIPDGD